MMIAITLGGIILPLLSSLTSAALDNILSLRSNSVESIAIHTLSPTQSFVYLCGYLNTPQMKSIFGAQGVGRLDAYLMKMRSDGTRLWAKVIGTASGDEIATRVTVDSANGEVFLLGTTNGSLVEGQENAGAGTKDIFYARFYSNGTMVYLKQFGSPADDDGMAIASDPLRSALFIGGSIEGELASYIPAGGQDAFILRINRTSGDMLGVDMFGGGGEDFIADIVVGAGQDDIYATGSISSAIDGQAVQGKSDIIICRYDVYMDRMFSLVFGTSGMDYGTRLLLDPLRGYLYVGGAVSGSIQGKIYSGGLDSFVSQFPLNGMQSNTRPAWSLVEGSPLNEWCVQLQLLSNGNVMSLSTQHSPKNSLPYLSFQSFNQLGYSSLESFTKQLGDHGIQGKTMAVDTRSTTFPIYYFGGVYNALGYLGVYSTGSMLNMQKMPDYSQIINQDPSDDESSDKPDVFTTTPSLPTPTAKPPTENKIATLAELGDLQINALILVSLVLMVVAIWIVGELSLEVIYWYQLKLEEKEVFGPNYQYRRVANQEEAIAIVSEREVEDI